MRHRWDCPRIYGGKLANAIVQMRNEPAAWLSFDEETRHLLKHQAREKGERLTKRVDPLTGATIME